MDYSPVFLDAQGRPQQQSDLMYRATPQESAAAPGYMGLMQSALGTPYIPPVYQSVLENNKIAQLTPQQAQAAQAQAPYQNLIYAAMGGQNG